MYHNFEEFILIQTAPSLGWHCCSDMLRSHRKALFEGRLLLQTVPSSQRKHMECKGNLCRISVFLLFLYRFLNVLSVFECLYLPIAYMLSFLRSILLFYSHFCLRALAPRPCLPADSLLFALDIDVSVPMETCMTLLCGDCVGTSFLTKKLSKHIKNLGGQLSYEFQSRDF